MGFVYYNKNPLSKNVEDCVIRSVATVLDADWNDVFLGLTIEAYIQKDLINSNVVWGSYLMHLGFNRLIVPNTCPICYTIRDFAQDHPIGRYVVGDGSHAVAVIDGNYYDTFDSGDRTVIFYYERSTQ